MSKGNEGSKGKGSGRRDGKSAGASKTMTGVMINHLTTKGASSRSKDSNDRPTTRGGKNQVVGTSRSGNPVTKKNTSTVKSQKVLPKERQTKLVLGLTNTLPTPVFAAVVMPIFTSKQVV